MKGIIITGGDAPGIERFSSELTGPVYIIAADSGLDTCLEYGITPDFITGDMDSIKNKKKLSDFPSKCVKIFPKDKDETDTEIAFRLLRERGIEKTVIVGGGGGRTDHFLGIVSLFDRDYHPSVWYTAQEMIVSIDSHRVFYDMEGAGVSFFPAGNGICKMKSSGLKWNLDGLQWVKGDAGISNKVLANPFSVEMETGRLIMIYPFKEF